MDARRGDWVRIYEVVLKVGERAPNIPGDTRQVPLQLWNKGFLLNEAANIGDRVEVETYIGRKIVGTLVEVNPYYDHDFGRTIPELFYIGRQVRSSLAKGDK